MVRILLVALVAVLISTTSRADIRDCRNIANQRQAFICIEAIAVEVVKMSNTVEQIRSDQVRIGEALRGIVQSTRATENFLRNFQQNR